MSTSIGPSIRHGKNVDRLPEPHCITCSYLLSNLPEPRCPECGRPFDLDDPKSFRRGALSRFSSYWLSPPGKNSKWVLIGISIITTVGEMIPGGVFVILILSVYGWFVLLAWWLLRFIVWCVANVVTGFVHHRPKTARRWLITPAFLGLVIACAWLRLPLYASFFVSLPSMNRLAQQVTAAGPPPSQTWTGIFPVERVEKIQGGMRFLVRQSGFMNRGGFAYSPNGPPQKIGDDHYRHLYGDWYEWTESF